MYLPCFWDSQKKICEKKKVYSKNKQKVWKNREIWRKKLWSKREKRNGRKWRRKKMKEESPVSCTLCPVPYVMYLMSCTLCHAFYNLCPVLYPVSFNLCHVSFYLCPLSCVLCHVSFIWRITFTDIFVCFVSVSLH